MTGATGEEGQGRARGTKDEDTTTWGWRGGQDVAEGSGVEGPTAGRKDG